jgi:hypothetical protein
MSHIYHNGDLVWDGDDLRRAHGSRKPLLRIVPDAVYPGMWRVEHPDGSLSVMVTRRRAKEAGRSIALRELNLLAQAS